MRIDFLKANLQMGFIFSDCHGISPTHHRGETATKPPENFIRMCWDFMASFIRDILWSLNQEN